MDEVLTVLLSTAMLLAGVLAFVLDNILPGTCVHLGTWGRGEGAKGILLAVIFKQILDNLVPPSV